MQALHNNSEALHPEREPLGLLEHLRRTIGEYNFAGRYQQQRAPFGGGMVKAEWFKTYTIWENNLRSSTWSFRAGIQPTKVPN